MNNLALVLSNVSKYEEAEEMRQRALELREKVFGKDHPSIRKSRNTLPNCLRAKGRQVVIACLNILYPYREYRNRYLHVCWASMYIYNGWAYAFNLLLRAVTTI
jgi:hypothetical protein